MNPQKILTVDEKYRYVINKINPEVNNFDFEKVFEELTSDNIQNQHRASVHLHKHYLANFPQTIPDQFQQQLVLRLIELSVQQQYPLLKHQALSTLVCLAQNIFNHKLLRDNGIKQLFISLIDYQNPTVSQLAISGLGKILSVSPSKQIEQSSIDAIITYYQLFKNKSIDNVYLQTLSQLLPRFLNKISHQTSIKLLSLFNKNISQRVRSSLVHNLHHFFSSFNLRISSLFQSGIVLNLIKYLHQQCEVLISKSLQILANIVLYERNYADILVNFGIIHHLELLFEGTYCYFDGTAELVIALFDSHNITCVKKISNSQVILRKLLTGWKDKALFIKLRLKMCCFFSKIISFEDSFKIFALCKEFNLLRAYLDESKSWYIVKSIEVLPAVLELGEKFKENGRNVFVDQLYKNGTVERLQMLMLHNNQRLVSLISLIFYRYIAP